MNPTPPTFPARPVNGVPVPKAPRKFGDWYFGSKYNGWRTLTKGYLVFEGTWRSSSKCFAETYLGQTEVQNIRNVKYWTPMQTYNPHE